MRPDTEDRAALRILLSREDLSDYDAEFIESLRNWRDGWSVKQGEYFDRLWAKYY